jgi:uncharacterized membrane protein
VNICIDFKYIQEAMIFLFIFILKVDFEGKDVWYSAIDLLKADHKLNF